LGERRHVVLTRTVYMPPMFTPDGRLKTRRQLGPPILWMTRKTLTSGRSCARAATPGAGRTRYQCRCLGPHTRASDTRRVVNAVLDDPTLVLLWDERILEEYAEVLARPKLGIEADRVRVLIDRVRSTGERLIALR
jgi:hypothetical protein